MSIAILKSEITLDDLRHLRESAKQITEVVKDLLGLLQSQKLDAADLAVVSNAIDRLLGTSDAILVFNERIIDEALKELKPTTSEASAK